MARRILRLGVLVWILPVLAACQQPQPAATPSPSPRPTVTVIETVSASVPTATATQTFSTLETPEPPYLQSGGAVPPNALARIGIGDIRGIEVYPDKSRVLLQTASGLYVYRLPNFELVWRRYLDRPAIEVSLSHDGSRIATLASGTGIPSLFDAETGERIADFPETWFEAKFSPDGRYIVAKEAPPDGTMEDLPSRIYVFDSRTGIQIRTLEAPASEEYSFGFSAVEWSRQSAYLAARSGNQVLVWNIESGERLHTIFMSCSSDEPYWFECGLSFSPDDSYLALRDFRRVAIVDLVSGKTVFEMAGLAPDIAWADNSLYIAGTNRFDAIETDTWTTTLSLDVTVERLVLSPMSHQIALASAENATILDTNSQSIQYTTSLPGDYLTWSPEGRWLFNRYWKGTRIGSALIDGTTGGVVSDPFNDGMGIIFLDENQALRRNPSTLELVDLTEGKVSNSVRLGVGIASMGWANENQLVLSGSDGDWIWSEATGDLEKALSGDLPTTSQIKIPDMDKIIKGPDQAHLISPDGRWQVVPDNDTGCGDGPFGGGCGIFDGSFGLYRRNGDQPITEHDLPILTQDMSVSALGWMADGSLLAAGLGTISETLDSSRILLIDPAAGEVVLTLEGHLGQVTGLLFSPDGTRLASTSADGTVIVWNVAARP